MQHVVDMGGQTEAVVSAAKALQERSTEGPGIQVGSSAGPIYTLTLAAASVCLRKLLVILKPPFVVSADCLLNVIAGPCIHLLRVSLPHSTSMLGLQDMASSADAAFAD